jgi:hypothetical protein
VGLFGHTTDSNIANVGLVDANITGASSVGALAGRTNGGSVRNSYSTGTVTGVSDVGGLVGFNFGSIYNSYSQASVIANGSTSYAGGLAGQSVVLIDGSYATGTVTGGTAGGLAGYNNQVISNSFWGSSTSGKANGIGTDAAANAQVVIGLNATQVQTQASYAGWDFANTWVMYEGHTAPLLRSFLTPLTVTANNANTSYDGQAHTGSTVSYSTTPNANLVVTNLSVTGGGTLAGTYALTPGGLYSNQQGYLINYVNGALTINPRAQSVWTGASGGNWSDARNWDVLPVGNSVLSVLVNNGTNVTYDAAAGSSSLQSIRTNGGFTMAGGALNVSGSLLAAQYAQTGGAVTGTGSFAVTNSFNQSAGSIAMSGPVSITQASGDLSLGSLSGTSLSLEASTGSIVQTGALTAGLLKTLSAGATTLDHAANHVSRFDAGISGAGNLAFTNVGVLDVTGITVANGNIALDNTGAVFTTGALKAPAGTVSITAHSPITIASNVDAGGNILLSALSTNSSSNITVNGNMNSTYGGISVQAYNNFIQNAHLSAALAIDVAAGGTVLMGPGAFSVGNPVSYKVNGASYVPPWIASVLSGGPNTFVASFFEQFQLALDSQTAGFEDPLLQKLKDRAVLVVEGEACVR